MSIKRFLRASARSVATDVVVRGPVHRVSVLVSHPHGLHTAPSRALSELMRRYPAAASIRRSHGRDHRAADAKSLFAILMLGIAFGERIELTAIGDGAGDAVVAAESLLLDLPRRFPAGGA